MRGIVRVALLAVLLAGPATGEGLSAEEAAALRERLSRLSSEVADLRARLGGEAAPQSGIGGRVMVRLDRIEVELSRLTGRVEELSHRLERIARDGGQRLSALDLRVTDLEGGDVAALAPPRPLGSDRAAAQGDAPGADRTAAAEEGQAGSAGPEEPDDGGRASDAPRGEAQRGADQRAEDAGPAARDGALPDIAPGEDPMLALAIADIRQGRFDQGEERLEEVLTGAPDAEDAARAHFWLGKSRFTRGRHGAAARSFLNAYNTAQSGPMAPEALLQLGITLGRLGQTDDACLTLREVRSRFADRDPQVLAAADAEADALACGL